MIECDKNNKNISKSGFDGDNCSSPLFFSVRGGLGYSESLTRFQFV